MIVLIKDNNGEAWEDYRDWVSKVYEVDTDNEFLEKAYNEWFAKGVLEAHNITVNPNWVNNIMTNSKCKNKSILKKYIKQNTFEIWLNLFYVCKELKFQEAWK